MRISQEILTMTSASNLTVIDPVSRSLLVFLTLIPVILIVLFLLRRFRRLESDIVIGGYILGLMSLAYSWMYTWHSAVLFDASGNTAHIRVGYLGRENVYDFPLTDVTGAFERPMPEGYGAVYLEASGRPPILLYQDSFIEGLTGRNNAHTIDRYLGEINKHAAPR